MDAAPIRLNAIINYGEYQDQELWLNDMFKKFLPNDMGILKLPTEVEQVHAFAGAWARNYFPLDDHFIGWITGEDMWFEDDEEDSSPWASIRYKGLPFETAGFDPSDDALHFFVSRYPVAQSLVGLMCGIDRHPDWGDDALRVSWMEELVSKHGVEKGLLQRIPEKGWDHQELNMALRGTRYECIGVTALWLWNATGVALADEFP